MPDWGRGKGSQSPSRETSGLGVCDWDRAGGGMTEKWTSSALIEFAAEVCFRCSARKAWSLLLGSDPGSWAVSSGAEGPD